MPLPKRLTRFNRLITNRLTRPFAARLGGFAVIRHQGRRSGQSYATPVNAFRHDDLVVVALTYGSDVDWLKNSKANHSILVMGGEEVSVGLPIELSAEEGLALMPGLVRLALKGFGVTEFVDFPVLNSPS
ncbi:MAG: nitroreductase family deazaflavin-dependent oxidoreductase [Acidimicrobiia bacterium]